MQSTDKSHLPRPCLAVLRQQNRIVFWALFHILCILCLAVGIHYIGEYMHHPDRIILMDRSGSLYYGHSGPVLSREVAEDMACRAAIAFLERSFEQENRELCEAVFGKTARKALFELVGRSRDEFTAQKIRQYPEISKLTVRPAPEPGQCLVWVEGVLHRTGIYMNMAYYRKLQYVLGLRLMRSASPEEFPLRVLRMTYEERALYDDRTRGGA